MTTSNPRIVCVAVIGKKNSPLHLSTYPPTTRSTLDFHFLVHTTLDIFTSRLPSKANGDSDFGLLYAVDENTAAYGWLTNTGIKFVVVVEGGEVREGDVKSVMRALQTSYIRLVCNPFYENDEREGIRSRRFEKEVEEEVGRWGEGKGAL